MAFGPLYTGLPLAAATATRPSTRYVDENSWNTLIGNFSLWQGDVNANAKTLSNVVLSAGSAGAPMTVQGTNVAGADAITGLILDRGYDTLSDSMDIVWGSGSGMAGTRLARLSVAATGPAEAGFIFYAQGSAIDGYSNEIMRVHGNKIITMNRPAYADVNWRLQMECGANLHMLIGNRGGRCCIQAVDFGVTANQPLEVVATYTMFTGPVRIAALGSTNPGAGNGQLWYDPADGNRVKYAP
jgi:hypothetical protein